MPLSRRAAGNEEGGNSDVQELEELARAQFPNSTRYGSAPDIRHPINPAHGLGPVGDRRAMIADAVDLDEHRGMMAQRATDIRLARSGYADLRQQQEQLEDFLLAAPSASWPR